MDKRFLMVIAAAVAFIVVGVLVVTVFSQPSEELRGTIEFDPPIKAADFTLIDQNGVERSLSDFGGKPIALSFIYSSCPDICPIIVGKSVEAYKMLEQELRGKIVFIFVTVDPARDTPEVLKEWAQALGADLPDFYFMTGRPSDVAKVWRTYAVAVANETVKQGEVSTYFVAHSAHIYFIDKDFRIRVEFTGHPDFWSPEDIAHNMRVLARE